jgi:hypothetical protein
MALTYTWEITGIKTKDEGANRNAVVQTYWSKTGTDENGNTGVFDGVTAFTTTNMPEGYAFIPFEQVTEEMILDWIKAVVVGEYEDYVNAYIQKKIDEKINPPVQPVVPWAAIEVPST